jgi:hypothetical protein
LLWPQCVFSADLLAHFGDDGSLPDVEPTFETAGASLVEFRGFVVGVATGILLCIFALCLDGKYFGVLQRQMERAGPQKGDSDAEASEMRPVLGGKAEE